MNSQIIQVIIIINILLIFSGCGWQNYLRNYTRIDRPRYAQLDKNISDQSADNNIKITSYNIEYGLKVPKAIRILSENQQLKNTDILLLQEMDFEGVKKIADALNFNYVYYPAVIHPIHDRDFGNAILSKWPITDDEKVILPSFDLRKRQRIAVGATLHIHDKLVRVYCVHLGIFVKPSERRERIEILLNSDKKNYDGMIVGGDFNSYTKKDRLEIDEMFKKHGFINASKGIGWTFKQWYFFNRRTFLDHIYTKDLSIIDKGKVKDRTASDHVPIWVEVE